jgi:hypothetical protein
MRLTILAAVAALALASPANAQLRCDQFGDFQTCTGPGGYSSRESTFGDFTRGSDTLGNQWTTSRFGDVSTTNIQPGFGRRFNNGW